MNQDAIFRPALVVGFLAVVLVTLYHRLRFWAPDEKLDPRQESPFIQVTLRPVALMLWLGVIAYMINPSWMAWSEVPLPAWLRWTGVGACVIGACLLTWTLRSLGANMTGTVVTRRSHALVTHGPYRWVRHPAYDSMTLLIMANSLMAANWFLFVTGSVVFLLIVVRTRTEEQKLLARFGNAYRVYMERTGRFFPRAGPRKPGA